MTSSHQEATLCQLLSPRLGRRSQIRPQAGVAVSRRGQPAAADLAPVWISAAGLSRKFQPCNTTVAKAAETSRVYASELRQFAKARDRNGGAKAAVRFVDAHRADNTFVFRTDVKSYYASIDHEILLTMLDRHVPDRRVRDLLRQYVRRTIDDGGLYEDVERGISLGCQLSPLMGAFYLKLLDERMETTGLAYARFMDDWVILAPTRWKLRAAIRLNSSTQQGKWTRSIQLSRPTQFQHLVLAPMTRSVILDARQRQALLDRYCKDPDPEVRFRAHILLLLADGHTWATVATFLFCSSRTIDRWVKRFHREGVEAVAGHKPGRHFRFGAGWLAVVVDLVSTKAPRDFGFLRSRWCCEVVALLILRLYHLDVSRETIRRWLHRGEMVYHRPRPVLKPDEEERRAKLAELRQLLAELPDDETAVFQDEVDINTNPKIGSMWMFKGQQAEVETPGDKG